MPLDYEQPLTTFSAPVELPPRGSLVHCVGICGMGMAPLALALRSAGWRVTGEDRNWPPEVEGWLRSVGVERLEPGSLPEETALVVHSTAVSANDETRSRAVELGIPVARRGATLAALVHGRPLVAVAGSHGKTTTTAMLASALLAAQAGRAADFDFDYVAGGLFADNETPPARWQGRGWVVAEIDESDGTIEAFAPEILVCVNLDWDHCDHYPTADEMTAAFAALAERTKQTVLFNHGCEKSRGVFGSLAGPAAPVSFGRGGDYALIEAIVNREGRQALRLGGRFGDASTSLNAWGEFNAVNATAALAAAALMLGDTFDSARSGLETFGGVRRRQGVLWQRGGVCVLEDYAHHPAEIGALIAGLRLRRPRRLRAVFQPHRYTRTRQFKQAFARALAAADEVIVLPVYAASENPVEGGRAGDLLAVMQRGSAGVPVRLLADPARAASDIVAGTEPGDLLAFIGAGDIDQIARRAVALLAARAAPANGVLVAFHRVLEDRLSPETTLRFDEPLGPKTTMRVGGAAAVYAEPANTADLQTIILAARAAGLRVYLLGRGSNLIVPDDGVHGLVVRLNHAHWRRLICLGPGRYWVGAGLRLRELCSAACRMGESGFEFLEGIPGTVGGALRMNAGAMDGWMHDLVEEIHLLDPAGRMRVAPREALHVEYRRCVELEDAIAIGAVLRAQGRDEGRAIRERLAGLQTRRQSSQPREPSAGCIFKNPPGDSAGRLIDELGLKGLRIGGAEVSGVHANFIVNRGGATSADIIALVRRVRDEVRSRCDIELEPEALLYGCDWTEVLK